MNINALVQAASRMFPNAKVGEALNQAQQMTSGTGNNLNSVAGAAQKIGLNANFIQQFYSKFADTPQAKMICGMLGTSPEALRDDAMRMVNGEGGHTGAGKPVASMKKFPRLK